MKNENKSYDKAHSEPLQQCSVVGSADLNLELTSENVHELFVECLFEEGEKTDNAVIVQGLVHYIGFNPDRLKNNSEKIQSLLKQLPDSFQQGKGDGMSFLNMCETKTGNQWCDLHSIMDELVCLGLATNKMFFLMPREMWNTLPGGMPYVAVRS